ncbi:hypothetical protein [Hymenobacter canadensis]|uniref:PilZ domain-containing protein n=1 Tax=Hymenobacter canadensis TaxID=2999067 RepID=A0ABY7LKB1_9BACT|nr:hypothetical protein [Hymenobacter canadensis]WBA40880.1 hypothetical protein O3303_13740 [Hymenobacter canadensis]
MTQLGLAFLLFRFLFRTLVRRGELRFPNPFQPGWKQLQRQYGIAQIVRPTEQVSGFIGAVPCDLKVRLEAQHWVLQGISVAGLLVRIPYADIESLQTPTSFQVMRFSEKEYTAGVFRIGKVRVELPAYWADQLLQHMAAAGATVIS